MLNTVGVDEITENFVKLTEKIELEFYSVLLRFLLENTIECYHINGIA